MLRINLILVTVVAATMIGCKKSPAIEWRNDRTGIYNETGLLKTWDPNGPELLWSYEHLGIGHSSVAISNNRLYIAGMEHDGKGYLHVFDLKGKKLNKIMYGNEWDINYEGSRGTPSFSDGKIYLITGVGDVICLDEKTLEVVWRRNVLTDFDAKNITWGITESPLIIDDKIIVTPGGELHNMVALNKNTGELIWSSPGVGEPAAYCSPLYIGDQETPLIATMTAKHIIGVEAATGRLLWSFEHGNMFAIQSNTAIYGDNMVLFSSVDQGTTMLKLSNGGRTAEIVWQLTEFDNMMGGLVKLGDYVFGSCRRELWYCVNWYTGEIMYAETGLGVMGVTVYADGMLYCYSESGEMALVKPDTDRFNVVSKFNVPVKEEERGPHWAHHAIYKGVLYVRHNNTLMAYKVK